MDFEALITTTTLVCLLILGVASITTTHADDDHDLDEEYSKLSISIRHALKHAVIGYECLKSLGKEEDDPERAALISECVELYAATIHRLHQIVDPKASKTQQDLHTWLTATLTNLETCRDDLLEVPPHLNHDLFLPLISNMIAHAMSTYKYFNDDWIWMRGSGVGKQVLRESSSYPWNPRVDAVVSKDGCGDYTTIQEAIDDAASIYRPPTTRYVILVKAGIYTENVKIPRMLTKITLLGDGIGNTIITANKSKGGGDRTYGSATAVVEGDGFIGRGITFRNTAGPGNHQAVALRSNSDKSVFYKCSFEGYQDTLYVHQGRQFYRECDIYGTVDFIFGKGSVVLQNCNIYARYPPNKLNTITAQGRKHSYESGGFSIHNCTVRAAQELKRNQTSVKTYLGRPWKEYSRTVFLDSYLDDLIDPQGWKAWNNTTFALKTLYFGEYKNRGPGSSTKARIRWPGYHPIHSSKVASPFTVANFIDGNSWLPSTHVPFSPGF